MSADTIANASPLNLQPLTDFVTTRMGQPCPRARLSLGPVEVYVRITTRYLGGEMRPTIDLADVTVLEEHRNRRLFTSVLAHLEALARQHDRCIYVESIISPIVRLTLTRRGYSFEGGELGNAWKDPGALHLEDAMTP